MTSGFAHGFVWAILTGRTTNADAVASVERIESDVALADVKITAAQQHLATSLDATSHTHQPETIPTNVEANSPHVVPVGASLSIQSSTTSADSGDTSVNQSALHIARAALLPNPNAGDFSVAVVETASSLSTPASSISGESGVTPTPLLFELITNLNVLATDVVPVPDANLASITVASEALHQAPLTTVGESLNLGTTLPVADPLSMFAETPSHIPVYTVGSLPPEISLAPATNQSSPLVELDTFRADPRFAGVDGSGTTNVDYSVSGNASSASPADASDFLNGVFSFGSVTFSATETSKTLTIEVAGDETIDSDESFTVTLAVPGGGRSAERHGGVR
jgi:hypothetical protein